MTGNGLPNIPPAAWSYFIRLQETAQYRTAAIARELDALVHDPSDIAILRARGFCHAYIGLGDQAIADLTAVVAVAPAAREIAKLAQLHLARSTPRDIDRAEEYAQAVLKNNAWRTPDARWLAHQVLAGVYLKRGDRERAATEARNALKIIEDDRSRAAIAVSETGPAGYPSANLHPPLLDEAKFCFELLGVEKPLITNPIT